MLPMPEVIVGAAPNEVLVVDDTVADDCHADAASGVAGLPNYGRIDGGGVVQRRADCTRAAAGSRPKSARSRNTHAAGTGIPQFLGDPRRRRHSWRPRVDQRASVASTGF